MTQIHLMAQIHGVFHFFAVYPSLNYTKFLFGIIEYFLLSGKKKAAR